MDSNPKADSSGLKCDLVLLGLSLLPLIVNICLDRNTLVLIIDKRSPKRETMQKAEKKIQAF